MNWYFASGDMGFFWPEQMQALSWLPQVFYKEYGFGFNGLLSLWLDYPFRVFVKLLSTAGLSWFIIEKLLWLSVFALAVYSAYLLTKHWIGSLIFAANTYILLLFSGGQLGVAFAYAFSPFVLFRFITYQKGTVKTHIVNGLWFALLILFDLRIAYLMLGAIVLYGLKSVVPLFVAASVHLYWILPTLLASRGTASLGEQFTNPGMLKFLSFTDFPHALGLLHPNWPENLFGKVYFMQPEFLIIPLVAFGSLLFKEKNIRFFAILALIGAFFAKGVLGPFGGIFQWMFEHVPGFVMFRDPTKFYFYVAIAYSVLIPAVLKKINNKFVYAIFIIFWIFSLREINLKPSKLPAEYVKLKDLLVADTIPSRTLWIPQKENYAYFSDVHPILAATDSSMIDPSVKYIIVPIDVNKRIFLNDYTFDENLRDKIISDISLPRDTRFHDVALFENPNFTRMYTIVPAIVQRQQHLANIGAILSVVLLITFLCILLY